MGRRDDDDDDDDDDGEGGVHPAEADAALRFGLSLLLSVFLAAPALWAAFEGRRELDGALLHYLLCFAVARLTVGLVGAIYSGYRRTQRTGTTTPGRTVTGPLTGSR